MDVFSLSSILKELIIDVGDPETQEKFIFTHIKNVTKNKVDIGEFPSGEDWFNTTEPLFRRKHLQGKIVVLDFFTYCCINCLHVLPHLRALEENFSISDGLVVVGVHSAKFDNEKNSANVLSAIRRYNINHPVVNDKNGQLWNRLEISCWPTLMIIGPDGQPLFVLVGEGHKDELLLYVKCALKYYENNISSHPIPISASDVIVTSSVLNFPSKIACFEDVFAVSDSGNHSIVIFNSSGLIKIRIGGKSPGFKDGSFETARFNSPQGLAFFNATTLYVADLENHAVRLIDLSLAKVTTVAGTGMQGIDYIGGREGSLQEISSPWDLCFVSSGDVNLSLSNPQPFSIPSQSFQNSQTNAMQPGDIIPPPPPPPPTLSQVPPPPPLLSEVASSSFTVNKQSKVLLIAMSGTHQIWALFLDEVTWWKGKQYRKNECVAIAGCGKEENRNSRFPLTASFAQPSGLTYSPELKSVFVADSESSSIRQLSLKDGNVTHVVGGDKSPDNLFSYGDKDGLGHEAQLQHPLDTTWNSKRNRVFICDTYNHKVKSIDPTNSACQSLHSDQQWFNEPSGACFNSSEDLFYVADTNNHCIKTVRLSDGTVNKLDLRETETKPPGEIIQRKLWETEANISAHGGELTLKVSLRPDDIHGRWSLELPEKIAADPSRGEVTSAPIVLCLRLPPSDSSSNISVLFDLVLCQGDACFFRKYELRVLIKRGVDRSNSVNCDFSAIVA